MHKGRTKLIPRGLVSVNVVREHEKSAGREETKHSPVNTPV